VLRAILFGAFAALVILIGEALTPIPTLTPTPKPIAEGSVCCGELWNIHEDQGVTWIKIGHGVYQCSVKNVASETAKKILSVCNLGKLCTVRVEFAPKTDAEKAEHDGLVITDKDKVLSVRPGSSWCAR
jgi:hypothetical protein